MAESDFWQDHTRAKVIGQRHAENKALVKVWDGLYDEANALLELADVGEEQEILPLYHQLETKFREVELQALFVAPYDRRDALVSIHAGTGGVDAMDWAAMLARMYLRFFERMGWSTDILDEQRGSEAGIKRVDLHVKGMFAYGYCKAEHGVHRLVRISPFDAEGMRHTSFALVEVVPDLGAHADIVIQPEEIRIDVFRASGKGGQGVNTTDSAVRIMHLPTGIVVSCQNERSQLQNKEMALRHLKAKLLQRAQESRESQQATLRGEYSEAAWGNQIRSYVLNPYRLVKDHRTQYATADVEAVLDGEIMPFIEASLYSSREHEAS